MTVRPLRDRVLARHPDADTATAGRADGMTTAQGMGF